MTDPCQIIANSLTTVGPHEIMRFLSEYFSREKVDRVVVGYPKQLDNTDSENMKYIKPFLSGFRKRFPDMPVEMYDERFSSVLAHKALIDGGAKKKQRQNKAIVDAISATIIAAHAFTPAAISTAQTAPPVHMEPSTVRSAKSSTL